MPLAVADRVVESSTTTGTGSIALAGAVTGFRTFDSAIVDFDSVYYLIEAVDVDGIPSGDWEVGVGTFSSPSTLSRSSVIASSNSNAAVSFAAGTKRVHLTAPARQIGYAGCVATRSAALTGQDYTVGTVLAFDSEGTGGFDTDSFHDPVTNNSRITVDGTKYADCLLELEAQVTFANNTASNWILLEIRDDLGDIIGRVTSACALTNPTLQVKARPYRMGTTTRYFTVLINTQDNSVDITAATTWFKLKVLQ